MTRRERLFDLLSDRALVGISPDEEREVVALLAEEPGVDPTSFERAAAATALAGLRVEPMPAKLAARVEEEALEAMPTQVARPRQLASTVPMPDRPIPAPPASNVVGIAPPPRPPRRASRAFAIVGWIAAAACLALAFGAWRSRPRTGEVALAPRALSAERDALLARAGTKRLEWSATADAAARGASGDVVWNAALQRGFMRFRGLAKNDPRGWQYQLWIFDKTRDERYPVDGGVFDVDAETGDVVVAIQAKLPVAEPTLFAVTVEKPGGVVVSKRERIVVLAKPAG
jgi:hypothetical protein